ncbi:hypothetical protein Nepgr_018900 [Nepenthes gracilis]|uniref:Uncharacterized protein n=1 Tax=Nepenthes gracilis TaxID=150966 RepID=A0AAD3SUR5_NEPGR|nr:hypothetical protein Nepgr_018900 [Nepenthes gracilis]
MKKHITGTNRWQWKGIRHNTATNHYQQLITAHYHQPTLDNHQGGNWARPSIDDQQMRRHAEGRLTAVRRRAQNQLARSHSN